jgi:N-acetylmuramoyl-L-alanine amidase-like protein
MGILRTALFAILLSTGCGSDRTWAESNQKPQALPASLKADPALQPPVILSRQEWGAKAALPGMTAQKVTGVVVHHTGVLKNSAISLERKMRGLQNFSQNPGEVSPGHLKPSWPDVPYHFYVDSTGRIAEGRDLNFAGDTNTHYDTSGFIQVVLEGDFEKERPTPEQILALRDLLAWLIASRKLTAEAIRVHKDYAETDCPGKNLMPLLPGIIADVKHKLRPVARY